MGHLVLNASSVLLGVMFVVIVLALSSLEAE